MAAFSNALIERRSWSIVRWRCADPSASDRSGGSGRGEKEGRPIGGDAKADKWDITLAGCYSRLTVRVRLR